MADSGAIRSGRSYVEIFSDDSKLVKGLSDAKKKMDTWGRSMTSLGKGILAAGLALEAPLLGAAAAFAEMGTQMEEAAAKVGATVEVLSQLKYAAEQSGVGFDQLEIAFAKMARTIVDAAKGNKQAEDSLRQIGLTVNNLKGKSPDEQFKMMADGIVKIADPSMRAAEAMRLFGKSGVELLPMLDLGSDGIDKLMERADALGLTMSGGDAAAAKQFGQTIRDLSESAKMVVFQIGAALAPALTSIITPLVSAIRIVRDWISNNRQVVVIAAAIGAGLIVAGGALVAFGAVLGAAGTVIGTVISGLSMLQGAIAFCATPLGMFIRGVTDAIWALYEFTSVGGKMKNYLSGVWAGLVTDATGALDGIKDALTAGDWGAAAEILWLLIKMEFLKGEGAIENIWIQIKGFLLGVWDSLKSGFPDVVYGWGGAIAQFASSAVGAVMRMAAVIKKIWREITASISKVILVQMAQNELEKYKGHALSAAEGRELAGMGYANDPEARKASQDLFGDAYAGTRLSDSDIRSVLAPRLAKDWSGDGQDSEAAYQADLKAADDAARARAKSIDAWATTGLAMTPQDHEAEAKKDQESIAAQIAAANLTNAAEIAALKKKLEGQAAAAHQKAADIKPFEAPKFDRDAAAAGLDGIAKWQAAGTFNGQFAGQILSAGNNPMRDVAKHTEKTAKHAEKIDFTIAHMQLQTSTFD